MCKPKPGPRCSAHARDRLDKARAAVSNIEFEQLSLNAALHSQVLGDGQASDIRAQQRALQERLLQARIDHTAALREYETTPDGMKQLQAAIAKETDERVKDEMQRRLRDAEQTRAEQLDDYASVEAAKQRLAEAGDAEQAYLGDAQARVSAAEDQVRAAQSEVRQLEAERLAAKAIYDAEHETMIELSNEDRTRANAVRLAASNVATRARELYIEAGVDDRMAGYLSNDMVEGPSDRYAPNTPSDLREPFTPTGALKVKVKRNGPYVERTRAAARLAQTDEEFQAANERLINAIERRNAAQAAVANHRRSRYDEAAQGFYAKDRAVSQAHARSQDAERDLGKAQADLADRTARVGAGIPVNSKTDSLKNVRDEIQRNPDGSTNAWVYTAPKDGLPNGRYVPVVGITENNELTLSSGRNVIASEHYYRTTRGGATSRRDYTVVYAAPQAGAHPLVEEGRAPADSWVRPFSRFTDSTD